MVNYAIAAVGQPKSLSSDNSPLFNYHQWQEILRTPEIEGTKSIPLCPVVLQQNWPVSQLNLANFEGLTNVRFGSLAVVR